jgi:hypothetical protein
MDRAGGWWLVLPAYSEQADTLGYHDLMPASLPIGDASSALRV